MSTVSKPYTFSASTTASSSQVNANFDTIYDDYNGGISAANLATGAVTTTKIADDAVTADKVADGAINAAAKISDGAVSSEKLGATIACRAYRSAAANVGSGPAKVVLDAEDYDVGGDFNTTTGTFTAPVTGYYYVYAQLGAVDVDASGALVVFIYVNGGTVANNRVYSDAGTNDPFVGTGGLYYVTAGQTIEMYQDCTTTEAINTGSTDTFMSIHFVGY